MSLPQAFIDLVNSSEFAAQRAAHDDAGIADALNTVDQPGYVPARHVSVTLAAFPQLDGLIDWVLKSQTLPPEFAGNAPGTLCPFALYALFKRLERIDQSVGKGDLRSYISDITPALAQAQAAAGPMIPDGFREFFLSGEIKQSRAEIALGRPCMPADVESVRKGNN